MTIKSRLYVADDIQTLSDGKNLVVGLYSDGVLIVNIPKDSAVKPSAMTPVALPTFALMLTVSDLRVGAGVANPSLTMPDGSQGPTLQPISFAANPNQSINLLLKFAPFLVPQEGTFTLTMKIDGEEIVSSFEVRFRRG